MSESPRNIQSCKNCQYKKTDSLCPDTCNIFQDLKAEFKYDVMMEEKEDETEVT